MADDSEDADRTPTRDDGEASESAGSAAESGTDADATSGSDESGRSASDSAEPSADESATDDSDDAGEAAGSEDEPSDDSDTEDSDSKTSAASDATDESAADDESTSESSESTDGSGPEGSDTDDDSDAAESESTTTADTAADDTEDTEDADADDTSESDEADSNAESDESEEVDAESADAESDEEDTDAESDEKETAAESDDQDEADADAESAETDDEDEADTAAANTESDDEDETVTGTDGGAPASASDVFADESSTTSPGSDPLIADEDETGILSDGPESDEEMPLADHIEEMIRRLAVVLGIGGLVTLLLYPGADLVNQAFGLDLVSSTEVIDFLWNKHIPGAPEMVDRRPRVYGPLELLLTELKVAALGGLVVGLPAFVYETYLFMRPGLYSKERRYYIAAVPTSLILAFVGISFAHFIVLPAIFAYFTSYTTGTAVVAFGLKETFNLILILMGYNAIIFQIPLFVMLAIMMNLVTRRWLEARRLLFWGTFLGLAFLVSPDPTGMAPIIIGATMIALFEGTLFVLRWTGRGSLAPTADELAARRPYAVVLAALVGYLLSPLPAPTGYYEFLPSVVVDTLGATGLAVYTPVIIAGALVGLFELVSFLLRSYGRSRRMLRAGLAVASVRRPVWLAAVVVGYLGSPDPAVLRWATEQNLQPALAGGIAVGLVLGYEALRLLLASRERRTD